ncbi:MAG TPA: SRPBCC domain-containing protein [Streptosporangiaceae bacterium]
MTEISAVEVTLHIPAAPEDVFSYFTDPARYVQWMGSEAKLEPEPGGVYRIEMADGFKAAGEFLVVERPHRVAFTWGFADEEAAQHTKHEPGEAISGGMLPGSTRVTVTLEAEDSGSHLTLRHEHLPDPELREAH